MVREQTRASAGAVQELYLACRCVRARKVCMVATQGPLLVTSPCSAQCSAQCSVFGARCGSLSAVACTGGAAGAGDAWCATMRQPRSVRR